MLFVKETFILRLVTVVRKILRKTIAIWEKGWTQPQITRDKWGFIAKMQMQVSVDGKL